MDKMVRPIGITTGSVKDHLVMGKHDDLDNFSNLERTVFHHVLPEFPCPCRGRQDVSRC